MPHRRKPFIDKKHATTYRLIPGFVPESMEAPETEEAILSRKEEQRKYGVFYNDNYDYLQHLRSLTESATMVKVSDLNNTADEVRSSYGGSSYGGSTYGGSTYGGSVNFRMFSTEFEAKEERIDPDILTSLDEAPEVKITEDGEMEIDDNFLEDDFINKAGGFAPKTEKDDHYSSHQMYDIDEQDLGSDFDEYDSDNEHFYNDDDDDDDDDFDVSNDKLVGLQPRGRGNVQDDIVEAQTALILKNFEEGLGFSCVAQTIDNDDDGGATNEDYEHLKEILMQDKMRENKMMTCSEFLDDHANRPVINTSKYDHEEEEEFEWKEVPPSKPKFDCVSILSMNSNTRNLPTDIIPPRSEKKQSKKTSMSDTDPSNEQGLTLRDLETEMRLSRRADKAGTFRPEDETSEERKERKKAIKEERKERRQEKKANKIVFSMEKQKMDKEVASLSKSGKGIKLM